MLKYFVLSCLLSLSLITPIFSDDRPEKLYDRCLKPTIEVVTPNDEGHGTAFVVRSELVGHQYRNVAITCWHVVEDDPYVVVKIPTYNKSGRCLKYTELQAHTFLSNQKIDVAVLIFESPDRIPVAQLGLDAKLRFGDRVMKFGFGLGDDVRMDEGKITSVSILEPKEIAGELRTNCYLVPGDSGGPVFNSRQEVIGMTQSHRVGMGQYFLNIHFAMPITHLKTWDKEVNNSLAFVYNRKEKMPVMAFSTLRLKQYDTGEENEVFCPACWNEKSR